MSTVGFIDGLGNKNYETEQFKKFQCMGIKLIHINDSPDNLDEENEIDVVVKTLNPSDTLVVYELRTINKSLVELSGFFNKLREKQIDIVVVNKGMYFQGFTDSVYIDMLLEISCMQSAIARERTKKGLIKAKKNGKIGGRPTIASETVERIRYLYYKKKMTLRDVAKECDVSLGTVYKYVND